MQDLCVTSDHRKKKHTDQDYWQEVGGNVINYLGPVSTQTTDLTICKKMWNSVISALGVKYMTVDLKTFYLGTPLDRIKYMPIHKNLIPEVIIQQYNLQDFFDTDEYVYIEIHKQIKGICPSRDIGKQPAERETWKQRVQTN